MMPTSTVDGPWYSSALWLALTSDLYALPLFVVPVGFLIWSFGNWISYNKSNADRNTRLQDALDKKAYREIIVPLHGALTANLAETIAQQTTQIPAGVSVHDFLLDYEEKKTELLKRTDYTALEEVIKFQDTLEVVIREGKNKFVLKGCSRQNKRLMLAVVVASMAQVADSILTVVLKSSPYFSCGLWIWASLLVIILLLTGKYGLNENAIDNLENV